MNSKLFYSLTRLVSDKTKLGALQIFLLLVSLVLAFVSNRALSKWPAGETEI